MAIAETAAALGSIKAAYDIAKGINSLHTTTEVKQAVADILDQLLAARGDALEAQEKETTLLHRVGELEAEIDRLKAWDRETERYQLKRYHPGVLAYELEPQMDFGEPPHRLCYGCYQNAQKGVLQATGELRMRYRVHVCTSCRKEVEFGQEWPED